MSPVSHRHHRFIGDLYTYPSQFSAGTIESFNWDSSQSAATSVPDNYHLSDQYYDICIRRARGYCSLCFSPEITGAAAIEATSFGVSAGNPNTENSMTSAVGSLCTGVTSIVAGEVTDDGGTRGHGDYLGTQSIDIS